MKPTDPEICCVCRLRSGPNAVGKPPHLSWFCADCGPARAWEVHKMNARALDLFEQQAIDDAIAATPLPGDKSDLAEFTAEEARLFVIGLFRAFGASIRRQIDEGRAPF